MRHLELGLRDAVAREIEEAGVDAGLAQGAGHALPRGEAAARHERREIDDRQDLVRAAAGAQRVAAGAVVEIGEDLEFAFLDRLDHDFHPASIVSAIFSATIRVVKLVLARGSDGMIEASTTRSPRDALDPPIGRGDGHRIVGAPHAAGAGEMLDAHGGAAHELLERHVVGEERRQRRRRR